VAAPASAGRARPPHKLNSGLIVSHELRLDDAAEGYEKFDERLDGWTKVLLHPVIRRDNVTEPKLTALSPVCTLKPSPAPSSSQLIAEHLQAELRKYGVTAESVRCVDHDIKPGVEKDMGDDEWPEIREEILAADILILATPTWMGHTSSVGQRVLERLDAEIAETDDGRPVLLGKVAVVAVVGNEDGAHHIIAEAFQALNDVGYSIPAQGCTYWNGPAMGKTDYNDLDEVPEPTASATAAAARNAVHLARVLTASQYPPYPS
jgi:multimeric flavodoxin WrbA